MPQTAFDSRSSTKPRGVYRLRGPSKLPARNVKVVAMVPSSASR